MKCQSVSHVILFMTPWAVACQAPLSMGFSRQEYSGGHPRAPAPSRMTQRDVVGREVGGGFMFGNACKN